MRERIAQVQPDLPVVGVARERFGVSRSPRPDLHDFSVSCTAISAAGAFEDHGELGAAIGERTPNRRLRILVSRSELPLERRDLVEQLDLCRHAVGALQNRERDPQMFRQLEISFEVDRLAGARQVVELAALDRLADSLLGDSLPAHGGIFARCGVPALLRTQRRQRIDAQRATCRERSARRRRSRQTSPAPHRRRSDRPATRRTASRASRG